MPPALTAAPPRRALLMRAGVSLSVAIVMATACAWLLGELLGLGALYVPKVVFVLLLGSLAFAPLLARAHPFDRPGPANQVTLGRGVLAALLAGLLGEPTGTAAALVMIGLGLVALILDGVDGRLARESGMGSDFGARFDMETDAFVILVFSLLAWQLGKAGAWVILSGLLRYLFVAAGWLLAWMRAPLPPSRRRQAVCVIQVATMLAVVAPFIPSPWSDLLAGGTLAVLAWSFAVDVAWLAQRRDGRGLESTAAPAAKSLP